MSTELRYCWICKPCNRHYSLDDARVYEGKGTDIDPFVNFCPYCGQQLELDDSTKKTWGPGRGNGKGEGPEGDEKGVGGIECYASK